MLQAHVRSAELSDLINLVDGYFAPFAHETSAGHCAAGIVILVDCRRKTSLSHPGRHVLWNERGQNGLNSYNRRRTFSEVQDGIDDDPSVSTGTRYSRPPILPLSIAQLPLQSWFFNSLKNELLVLCLSLSLFSKLLSFDVYLSKPPVSYCETRNKS